jgi:hypothetical protein
MIMRNSITAESNDSRRSALQVADQINTNLGFQAIEVGSRLTPLNSHHVSIAGKPVGTREVVEALLRLELNLIPLDEAERHVGLSRTAFWRFRKRHRIHVLPGRRVNVDDIIDAFAAERGGKRRLVA